MTEATGSLFDTPVGKRHLDTAGSAVAVTRMDPAQAYSGIPDLLRKVIDEASADAWDEIRRRIDNIYLNVDRTLGELDAATGFSDQVKEQVKAGKKLLFKPNFVNPAVIDPVTHGAGLGDSACTPWPFVAALLRWFHDRLDIPYHAMAVGEAASLTTTLAGAYSLTVGRRITTEAVIEGRSGDFYGGWGFYFARKYLADAHQPGHVDDPMHGYDKSVSGQYFPPGNAGGRLMVYDLNRLYDVPSKAREVPAPDGANFQAITLHKVVVGGDPADPDDISDYPGCVLVNVPKLKMHSMDLITNAIKNLGIGLYPMEVASAEHPNSTHWRYASPHNAYPGMKSLIPHSTWLAETDAETGLPVRNGDGEYVVTRSAGMSATQADVIRATQNQGVFILHVVDAIEPTNVSHTGNGMGVLVPEGFTFASLDPVAVDLLCARYCFKMVPMAEARGLQTERGLCTDFIQKVSTPAVEGKNIVSRNGFDSPLQRYKLYEYAERRRVGQQSYHVVGWDALGGARLASMEGHLGRVDGDTFAEVMTSAFYHNPGTLLWDIQSTILGYLAANDRLTGSTFLDEVMEAFDENGDGVIDYDEQGKNGFWSVLLKVAAGGASRRASEQFGALHGGFLSTASQLKHSDKLWNADGHDFARPMRLLSALGEAFAMSRMEMEGQDPFFPGMVWGKGKWSSLQYASFASVGRSIYGPWFPAAIGPASMYGQAFQYADRALNGASYTGNGDPRDAVSRYAAAVAGGAPPLDFVLYVPPGFATLAGEAVPNVAETEDPERVLTARFKQGAEVW